VGQAKRLVVSGYLLVWAKRLLVSGLAKLVGQANPLVVSEHINVSEHFKLVNHLLVESDLIKRQWVLVTNQQRAKANMETFPAANKQRAKKDWELQGYQINREFSVFIFVSFRK
jgi:hypothetical protein